MTHIVVIGGTDSSGGAGLARDIGIAYRLGVEAMPVVTAITAQTDANVRAVKVSSPDLVRMQLDAALASRDVAAVKIGMLGNEQIVDCVAQILYRHQHIPLVLDPVLISSSGKPLVTEIGQRLLLERLVPRTTIITPNLDEAAHLTGTHFAEDFSQIEFQAHALLAFGAKHVLMKGGHGKGDILTDHLFEAQGCVAQFEKSRSAKNVRGTGCILASTIASHLALGCEVPEAVSLAQDTIASFFI
jgi:hydroxymethylpyrimidine/phosphomethylpyrimidine kinase